RQKDRGEPQDDRGRECAENPEESRDRHGQKQRLLPPVGSQIVNWQRQECQVREAEESPAFDLVPLEDDAQETEAGKRPREGNEPTAAGLGLSGVKAPVARAARRAARFLMRAQHEPAVRRLPRLHRLSDLYPHEVVPSRLLSSCRVSQAKTRRTASPRRLERAGDIWWLEPKAADGRKDSAGNDGIAGSGCPLHRQEGGDQFVPEPATPA